MSEVMALPKLVGTFRKKPVEIEALQWTGGHAFYEKFVAPFCPIAEYSDDNSSALVIPTLEGAMTVSLGDWIIKGIKGEFYPCKPDIFEATYDRVQEPVPA